MTLIYEDIMRHIAHTMDHFYLTTIDEKEDFTVEEVHAWLTSIRNHISNLFESYRPEKYDVRRRKFILEFGNLEEANQFAHDIKQYSLCYQDIKVFTELGVVVRMTGKLPFQHKFKYQAFPA